MREEIYIKGARQHNLKNITLKIPRDKLVVFTGVSGSGKSSLVYDTIHSEGRRRLLESLSIYERMGIQKINESDVDLIEGLSPVITIEQTKLARNPRSTVGTLTGLSNYLRLLFSRLSKAACPYCMEVKPVMSKKQMVSAIISQAEGREVEILASKMVHLAENIKYFREVKGKGFNDVRLNGVTMQIHQAEEIIRATSKQDAICLEVSVGRILTTSLQHKEIQRLIEKAIDLSGGMVKVRGIEGDLLNFDSEVSCCCCGIMFSELSANAFSYNSPDGACPTCTGIGTHYYVDLNLLIPDNTKSLVEGAINLIGWQCDKKKFHKNRKIFEGLAKHYNFSLNTPIKDLSEIGLNIILYGTGEVKIQIENPSLGGKVMYEKFSGIINIIYDKFKTDAQNDKNTIKEDSRGVIREQVCPNCNGDRLKVERSFYRINDYAIQVVSNMPLYELYDFCFYLVQSDYFSRNEKEIAKPLLRDMVSRITTLMESGLDYLNLYRPVTMLSGGESQRIRLTSQLSSPLMGMIYILDEPSVGLHARDTAKLIETLHKLRDLGNSVLVIEHDEDIISQADYIIEVGPGAGILGGQVVAQGSVKEVIQHPTSLIGHYLSGNKKIMVPKFRRKPDKYLDIIGANKNNLVNLDVSIPLGCFVGITGVSGSGKSTLVHKIIYEGLKNLSQDHNNSVLRGTQWIERVVYINQQPIGKTSRSNPATYVGVFDTIRRIFANTESAKRLKVKEINFSFNSPGGRCEACLGTGVIVTEMQFMPDVKVDCEVCQGKRYSDSILGIRYRGKNIAEVLDMSIEEAAYFYEDQPRISEKLKMMQELGLGYMKLGQPSTTLSGGEAQRLKLVEELSNNNKSSNQLYILDEPTNGLHLDDINRLLEILQQLVDQGNTVLVIEHNMQVIKTVDYIIDLGPGGGKLGGKVVAYGTPEEVAFEEHSFTGKFLRKILINDGVIS